jgi:uncharacterized protein GlcG (DUF336 family)
MAHLRDVRALTLEAAKAIAAAAGRFATERGWTVAVAVVDAAGGLLLFHCLDDTQAGSQDIAVLKARTAAAAGPQGRSKTASPAAAALLTLPGALALGAVSIASTARSSARSA